MAKISIIVPVYEAEETLRRCVESILAQTLPDFELLLLNDGSSDRSGALCDHYAKVDPRITAIHQKNMGVSASRNRGLELANGKYIMFCDSDDYVAPTWCQALYEQAEKSPHYFVGCNTVRVNAEGLQAIAYKAPSFSTCSYFDLWKNHVSNYVVSKIYERELLQKHAVRFPDEVSFAEDVAFNVAYFRICKGAVHIQDALYYYCDQPSSLMHRHYDDFFPIYSLPYVVRLPMIEETHRGEFCDYFLADFIRMFSYVFERKHLSLLSKLKFNQKILCSDTFQQCLAYASGAYESKLVIRILKRKNYYLYWCLERAVALKKKLFR